MRSTLLVLAALCLFSCGTTVTEGDRNIAYLDRAMAERIWSEALGGSTLYRLGLELYKNEDQLLRAWGAPKSPPPVDSKSDPGAFEGAGALARKQSEDEHSSSGLWGMLVMGVLMLAREYGVSQVPFLGPLIAKLSPKIANGSTNNENVAVAHSEVIDGLKAMIPAEKKEEAKNFIDRVTSRYGVAAHASALYEKYVKA